MAYAEVRLLPAPPEALLGPARQLTDELAAFRDKRIAHEVNMGVSMGVLTRADGHAELAPLLLAPSSDASAAEARRRGFNGTERLDLIDQYIAALWGWIEDCLASEAPVGEPGSTTSGV